MSATTNFSDASFGELLHDAQKLPNTDKYFSAEVVQSSIDGRLRVFFTTLTFGFFPSLLSMKPYTTGLTFTPERIKKIDSDFTSFCRFSNNSQLRADGSSASPGKLISTAQQAAFAWATPEQIANMYLLSTQDGNNPALKLLSVIKAYFDNDLKISLLKESAFIPVIRAASVMPESRVKKDIMPRCTITQTVYKGVPGFFQQYHTQYHSVKFSHLDPLMRAKTEYPWFHIYILMFVPLISGATAVPLATVITASDRSLEKFMLQLLQDIPDGKLQDILKRT